MSRKTLNQTIPNWMNNGIFANLSSLNVPWKNDVSGKVLDMKYHGNHSGMKKISPLLEALSNDDVIDNQNLTDIANILFEIYNKPWTKLYATMSLEYNPIENYRMVETEVVNGTNTGTVETDNNVTYGKQNDVNETSANTGTVETDNNVTYGKQNAVDETSANTGTVSDNTTLTKNTVQTTTNNLTDTLNNTVEELPEEVITKNSSNSNTSQDSVFGFDSVDAVNTDKTVDNGSVEDTETHSGKNTTTTKQSATKIGTVEISDTGTDTTASTRTDDLHSTKSYTDKSSGTDTTKETRTDNLHYTKSYTDSSSGTDTSKEKKTDNLENHTDRTLTRSGNIGVTTSQQMIESERQLWLWKYFDIIFNDVDSLLTIDIY